MSRRPDVACIATYLSDARFETYLIACDRDAERALDLYEWNSAVSAAFWEILGHTEIAVRNAMDAQLVRRRARQGQSTAWTIEPWQELADNQQRKLADACRNAARDSEILVHGRVIAELSLGFWRYMLTKQHNHLWPDLASGFPHLPHRDRRLVEKPLVASHRLRNRIAHHEPLLQTDLRSRHEQLTRLLCYIDPHLSEWVTSLDRVPALLDDRPA